MIRLVILFCLIALPVRASVELLELSGSFTQGGLVLGKTVPGSTVSLDGKRVRVSPNGQFVFGFGRDFKSAAHIEITLANGEQIIRDIQVSARKYKTEKVNGLSPSKVTPSEKFLKRIRKENGEIARVRSIDTENEWFNSGWIWPAVGRVSGVFGSQRVLNGIPKRPHFGLDVAAPVGTPIVASTDGIVRMAEKDLYYTGGTIMIDHGHGLVSVYSHLSKLNVEKDTFIRQGTKIGEIGKTGRASGPHLDWRLNWFKERLDPELLLGVMPTN
ncbi:peptidase [Alphaproteobacteria bacterium 46_93_T64]|nr:peptidase [Alphaproteobacteria bacterium 46_93_T64]